MARRIQINSLKDATRAVLLLLVISLHGSFVEEGVSKGAKPKYHAVVGKQKNYVKDATIEPVVFHTPQDDQSKDTFERHGFLKLKKDAPATILICHGYMCDKNDIAFFRSVFSNYNIMTFDFRAHGTRNEKEWCSFGKYEALDVISAVNYLKSRPETATKPLIAYGFSMGAVSAIEAQSKQKLFDAMVLDCPFESTDMIIKRALENLKFSLFGYEIHMPGKQLLADYAYSPAVQSFLKFAFKAVSKLDALSVQTHVMQVSPLDSIENITVPCLFIACKKDEKVPVDSVAALYSGAKGYKRLWITNGRRHFDSFFYNPEKYTHKVTTFINKAITNSLSTKVLEKIIEDSAI